MVSATHIYKIYAKQPYFSIFTFQFVERETNYLIRSHEMWCIEKKISGIVPESTAQRFYFLDVPQIAAYHKNLLKYC